MHGFEYVLLSASDRHLFDELLSMSENFREEIVVNNMTYEHIDKVYRAMLADNPQLFWLGGASRARITTSSRETKVVFHPEWREDTSSTTLRLKASRVERVVSDIVRNAKRYRTSWEQALYVHDYIVDATDYRLGVPEMYSAYGCLVNRQAVCAGYAAAFQLIMNRLGIPCGRVSGTDAGSYALESDHEWNYIRLGGEYYFIDVTWDDPVAKGGRAGAKKTHHYFCLSESELRLTHRIMPDGFVPRCTETKLNYYVYNHMFLSVYSFSALSALAVEQLKKGNKFAVKFGSRRELTYAKHDLLDNNNIFRIPGITGGISYSTSSSGLILTVEKK